MKTGVCEYEVSTEAWLMLLLHSASSLMEGHSGWVVNQDMVYSEVAPMEVANNGIGPSSGAMETKMAISPFKVYSLTTKESIGSLMRCWESPTHMGS